MRLLVDTTPLRTSADFRRFTIGGFAALLGTQVAEVALPFQVFRITHSSAAVGLLGLAELMPMLVLGLVGGALADSFDRRRLAVATRVANAGVAGLLFANAVTHPRLGFVYVLAAAAGGIHGLGGPSLTAMLPQLVPTEQLPAAQALHTLQGTVAILGGPLAAGLAIAAVGVGPTYLLPVVGLLASAALISRVRALPPVDDAPAPGWRSVADGFRILRGREILQATYAIDFVAMVFGMPRALFPAIALRRFGGPRALGLLYAAPAMGTIIVTATSGWVGHVRRHGVAIALAALAWGACIIGFGLAGPLWLAVALLAGAGAADMVSGLFRMTVWNTVIPTAVRGRLAGLELVNVNSGPLLGDVEAGFVAAWKGTTFSVVSGGIACIVGVALVVARLPGALRYRAGPQPSGRPA